MIIINQSKQTPAFLSLTSQKARAILLQLQPNGDIINLNKANITSIEVTAPESNILGLFPKKFSKAIAIPNYTTTPGKRVCIILNDTTILPIWNVEVILEETNPARFSQILKTATQAVSTRTLIPVSGRLENVFPGAIQYTYDEVLGNYPWVSADAILGVGDTHDTAQLQEARQRKMNSFDPKNFAGQESFLQKIYAMIDTAYKALDHSTYGILFNEIEYPVVYDYIFNLILTSGQHFKSTIRGIVYKYDVIIHNTEKEAVKKLLTLKDVDGRTFLHHAAVVINQDNKMALLNLIELAKNLHVSIDPQDNEGNTPLMLAIANKNKLATWTLFRKGADTIITNKEGQSAPTIDPVFYVYALQPDVK